MSSIQLRGNFSTDDARLGRLPHFDPRSRNFGVREILPTTSLKGKTWQCDLLLDQGIRLPHPLWDPSACTGHSATIDLAAYPVPLKMPNKQKFTNEFAFNIYQIAKTLDPWAGEAYEGSSVLAATLAVRQLGFIGEFRWSFGIDDFLLSLAHVGPNVAGTDWQKSMFEVRPSGLVLVEGGPGDTVGGHAYVVRGVITSKSYIRSLMRGERIRENVPLLRCGRQSWGPWGIKRSGDFFMWADDMERLLRGISYPGEARVTTKAFRR